MTFDANERDGLHEAAAESVHDSIGPVSIECLVMGDWYEEHGEDIPAMWARAGFPVSARMIHATPPADRASLVAELNGIFHISGPNAKESQR